mgnify:CR=1 FL=1
MSGEILTESKLEDTKRIKEILAMLKSRLLMRFQSAGHTTAALRASEIKADVILMAKNGVDGVYSADPKKDPNATKYDSLTYMDLISKNLQVMDTTATSMCMDNNIDLVVFNMNERGNIKKAVMQTVEGTTITKEGK